MPLLIIGALLILYGIFAIYSVSIFESFQVTLDLVNKGVLTEPTNYYYFNEQFIKLGIGIVLALITYFIPLRIIKKLKYVIFFGWLALVCLLFTNLWQDYKQGATLWIEIGWSTIQPWEFFKIGFVMFMASWLLRKRAVLDEMQYYIWFLVMTGLTCLVFLLLPDGGSLLLFGSVAMVLFRYAGGKIYYIVMTFILGLIFTVLAATQFNYIKDRINYFVNPSSDTSGEGIGRQTKQALLSVWWWGLIGKWYGKWLQKFGYIPEAQSDFIFAAFAEEVGFVGTSILVVLYFLLARYFLKRLPQIKDEYDRLLGVGILSLILMQAWINIGVNIKLIPLTGLTLPFISHGGSALLVNIIELVLLYKILEEPRTTLRKIAAKE